MPDFDPDDPMMDAKVTANDGANSDDEFAHHQNVFVSECFVGCFFFFFAYLTVVKLVNAAFCLHLLN